MVVKITLSQKTVIISKNGDFNGRRCYSIPIDDESPTWHCFLPSLDLERSDQNWHFKSDNYIIIPRMPMPEI